MKSKLANVDMDRGDRIANLRKEKGFSQNEFAHRVGIGRQSMSAIENGRGFRESTLAKISDVLGVSTDYIMNGDKQSSSEKENLIEQINSALLQMEPPELKRWLAQIQATKGLSA